MRSFITISRRYNNCTMERHIHTQCHTGSVEASALLSGSRETFIHKLSLNETHPPLKANAHDCRVKLKEILVKHKITMAG